MAIHELYKLEKFRLESGVVLNEAQLAYKTYGVLNPEHTNAILLCSFVTGTHEGYEFLIGEGRCFDPQRFFIIGANMFANGLSSSPSNTPPPLDGPQFPLVSIRDNVRAQHRLITEQFGIAKLALVAGFSMGAQQAYQWAVSYPGMVEQVAAWCGHAHTTPHTYVFLDGLASVLKVAVDWHGGCYTEPPLQGLRAMARAYAGWGMSPAWYREQLWTQLGCATREEFVVGVLEKFFAGPDANNFLAQIDTWKAHNVGDTPGFGGDYHAALASVQARVLVMPCLTDLYFPMEDAEEEAKCLSHGLFKPIPSKWGHWAGFGIAEADRLFLDTTIKELLAEKGR